MIRIQRRESSPPGKPQKTLRGFVRSPTVANELLEALPPIDREQLIAICEQVELNAGESLYEPQAPVRFVYFPTGSFASMLATADEASQVEVALIGSEGMWGLSSMLEITTAPFKVLIQGAGSAWRMETGEFLRQLESRPALATRMARYLYVRVLDLAQMVTCTRFHPVEPRLARWLLMTRDRAHTPQFPLTQELVATMLGVRRAGVTIAAGSLQKRGLIRYQRGSMTIRDRRGLERASCSCYARSREFYARHLS